jgi:hypothetical protein
MFHQLLNLVSSVKFNLISLTEEAGMFGLGGKLLGMADHVEIGEKITRGCVWAYDAMPAGIMPEIFGLLPCPTQEACQWDEAEWKSKGDHTLPRGVQNTRDPRYLLRPEAIESVFLMYRITGNEDYQDMAWRMFLAIQKATETNLAFSAILDVTVDGKATEKADSMEVCVVDEWNSHRVGTADFKVELLVFRNTEILLPGLLSPRPYQLG